MDSFNGIIANFSYEHHCCFIRKQKLFTAVTRTEGTKKTIIRRHKKVHIQNTENQSVQCSVKMGDSKSNNLLALKKTIHFVSYYKDRNRIQGHLTNTTGSRMKTHSALKRSQNDIFSSGMFLKC